MELRPLTRSVQEQLMASAAVGDETTQRAAQLLSVSLEPALRLALQEAIGQVAAEISADLAPGRVDLTMVGGELAVRVVPPTDTPPAPPHPSGRPFPPVPPQPPSAAPQDPADPGADAATSRVTFRPPQHLKARLEQAAAEEALSLNTYLVRALSAHLDQASAPRETHHSAGRTRGWFL